MVNINNESGKISRKTLPNKRKKLNFTWILSTLTRFAKNPFSCISDQIKNFVNHFYLDKIIAQYQSWSVLKSPYFCVNLYETKIIYEWISDCVKPTDEIVSINLYTRKKLKIATMTDENYTGWFRLYRLL